MMRPSLPNALGALKLDTSVGLRWRRTHLRVWLILLLVGFWILFHSSPPFPPSYAAEKRLERFLPQHDRTLPFPEGQAGRYVRFDTPKGTGFNHLLQRVILQHHVAVLGNRSYAFEPFVEDETMFPFKLNRWPWRSARIPLTALVGTVLNGFERFYKTPRAVSEDYFRSVCPAHAHVVHTIKSDSHPDGTIELEGGGAARIEQLTNLLHGSEKSCVRIVGDVFDDQFFNSPAPKEIIDKLLESPVLQHFTFAPSVLSLVNRMLPVIAPNSSPYDLQQYVRATSNPPRTPGWRHILALHLRRGDGWTETCLAKGMTSDPFVSFNKLPRLPGNENVPPPPEMVEATRMGLYRAKCLPDVTAIIARARRMRKNHPLLRSVYIMTDAPSDWVEDVRHWLSSDAWEKVIVGKADLYPDWKHQEIGMAADMEIARRAGVFIGNGVDQEVDRAGAGGGGGDPQVAGFSATSSNVVLLRTRDGVHPDFTQFW